MIKRLLGLSDDGHKNLKNATLSVIVANITLLLPFGVIIAIITTLLDPLINGNVLDTNRLWMLSGGVLLAVIVYIIAYKNEYKKTYRTAYAEAEKIRIEVAEHIRRLPLSFFNNKDLSELTTNMMADCASLEHTMSHVVPQMIGDIVVIALTCLILGFYNWQMALALFVALPLAFGLIFLSRKVQEKFGERHVQAKLNVSEQVQEYLEGIKVVKAFGLSGEKSIALEKSLNTMKNEAIKFEGIAGIFMILASMILQVGIGLVTLIGVSLLTNGSIDVITLLTFIVISSKVFAPITVILTLLPEFFYLLISQRRMQTLRLEIPMKGADDVYLKNWNIELKNVTFAYNEEDVLHDISLTIPQNGITAFVGPSGSGKSTMSRLIARFWDVKSGEILIGGKNTHDIDPECLMSHMSFVFQDVVLFNDTVINNIRIGKQDATDEEIYAAAKIARCDEFIKEMPNGYDTLIGENGSTLSGGERQRISIARALLKDAPIVLLDEATASLDPENEVLIQAAISALVKGRTVIVIAHRLRTVMGADKIAVLKNGTIVESGTGEELLVRNGLFSRLYKIQQDSLGWSIGNEVK